MQNSQLGKTAPRDKLIPNPKARLREQVREVMRFHHYSLQVPCPLYKFFRPL